jgi:F420-non-reducing hydrogenase iron-sulfur subunit
MALAVEKTQAAASSKERQWEPRIVAFFCNWCTYAAADLAGISRVKYSPNMRMVRVMCSGRIDPAFVLEAFRSGADGVLIGGCNPGDCHYKEGNYKTMRRAMLLSQMLQDLGIEKERFRLEWICASCARELQTTVNKMTEDIKRLGPLNWKEV